jgi:hypothetical protein
MCFRRSTLSWLTPTQGSSVFAATTLFEEIPSPSSFANTSRLRRKRRKISSPPTSRPGVQSHQSPSPPPQLLTLVLGVSRPLRRLSPYRRSCCAINPLRTAWGVARSNHRSRRPRQWRSSLGRCPVCGGTRSGSGTWWRIDYTPLGTLRGRYDEHSSKSSLSCETKVYRTIRRKPNFRRWCLLTSRQLRTTFRR